nr:hypothetical protein [Paenibacillus allorhizosphaerae]
MAKTVVIAWAFCLMLFFAMTDEVRAQQLKSDHVTMGAEHSGHMHPEAANQVQSAGSGRFSMQKAADSPGMLPVSVVSLIVMGLASLMITVKVRMKGASLPPMSGMMAAMSIGMTSSVTIGTTVGLMMAEMLVPTAIAVAFGMAAGYFSGQPYGLLASMDGMLAGLMGGMMGAMLGVMAAGEHPVWTVLFMDLVFLILLIPLYALLKEKNKV